MNNKINVQNVIFDNISLPQAVEKCMSFLETKQAKTIHTPNAEIVQNCVGNDELYSLINSADLIVPDGIGVILAAKILKTPFSSGRVPGVELCESLIAECAKKGKRVFFLGGKKGVPERAAQRMREKYEGLIVSGFHDGYFDLEGSENDSVIGAVNDSMTDFLIVCLGSPAQEKWMYKNKDKLCISLMGGFGGSVDIFAGEAKRAPKFFCDTGLEWLYRLAQQPKRIGRVLKLPRFLLSVIYNRKGK